jgi:hypothetical protein
MKYAIEHEDKVGKLLDTDKCIKAIRRIEEAKITSIDNATRLAKVGRLPQNAVPAVIEIEKSKCLDKLFIEEGIENEDIGKTVRANKLQENEDFKKMVAECQEKFKAAQATWQQ